MGMARTFEESQLLYERVKTFFWRRASEADYVVAFSDTEMKNWEIISTGSEEEMFTVRLRLWTQKIDYAGFVHCEGRYCYYYVDQNFMKTQYLDSGEFQAFHVHSFCEFDMEKVAEELQQFLRAHNSY